VRNQQIAAIDLGTNTARLLVGTITPDGIIQPLVVKRHITRLGGGFSDKHGLSKDAWRRSMDALKDFAVELARYDIHHIRAVATSAVREARNGSSFCEDVLRSTGIKLEIINGHEEAMLTLSGVSAGLSDPPKNLLVFDIGGGSTEYTLSSKGSLLYSKSLPLGVVRITEGSSGKNIKEIIDNELNTLLTDINTAGLLPKVADSMLVGTAGTATTLAAINLNMADYDYRLVNNHILNIDEIISIYNKLLPMSSAERLQVTGLEKGREDLIISGIILTLSTMKLFNFKKLTVSDFGLLEGVFLSLFSRLNS
jgi:exopolyphosphatase/guanosine-5'-triphosphate,3'-diphosphate pyrophosphatase